MAELALLLRKARGSRTQSDVATAVGLSRNTVVALEKGRGSVEAFDAVSRHLGLRISLPEGASIGTRVAKLREQRGWSAAKFAAKAELSPLAVRRLEKGSAHIRSFAAVIRAFDVQVSAPSGRLRNARSRSVAYETFRTPAWAYRALFDYRADWFSGSGYDPSAGDGRMIADLVTRGHLGPHHLTEIRSEEEEALRAIPGCDVSIADYLSIERPAHADFMVTNPPFSHAAAFVRKARTHVDGAICVLQSIAWQGTQARSAWLKTAGLAYVLNLPRRPIWETDGHQPPPTNIWDYAWFVFLPDHEGLPQMDWL